MHPSAEAHGNSRSALKIGNGRMQRSGLETPSLGQLGVISKRRFPSPAEDVACVPVRYAIEDYAIDPVRLGDRLPDAFVRLSDNLHYRFDAKGSFGNGRYEFCGFTDGFYIIISETEYYSPQSGYTSCPDSLQIYVASSGDGEYVPARGDSVSFEAPSAAIIIEPAGEPAAEVAFAGHTRHLYIVIHRKTLKSLYAGDEHELPTMLQAFLGGGLQGTVGRALPLGGALLRCLDEVHTSPLEGRRRRLFLQSKAIEILCQTLEALEQGEGFRSAETTRLTERGVLKAQRLIADNFVTPPSLEDLALKVGLSRSALCTGFRQILGQSVFEYIHDLRMDHALALLNQRDASITQVAFAVGYNRASSFSVAVQRYFGATPTELRLRGALPKP